MNLTAYKTIIHTSNSSRESFHGFHFCLYYSSKFFRVGLNLLQYPTERCQYSWHLINIQRTELNHSEYTEVLNKSLTQASYYLLTVPSDHITYFLPRSCKWNFLAYHSSWATTGPLKPDYTKSKFRWYSKPLHSLFMYTVPIFFLWL